MSNLAELKAVADQLTRRGKGILACDESTGTIGKRLVAIGLKNDEETRRRWRDCLLTADSGSYLSGAILFAETLGQSSSDRVLFPAVLAKKGVLPGVKVDLGLQPMGGGETCTSGLDRLSERLEKYYGMGARFCKWRSALKIDAEKSLPSDAAVAQNALELAKYAKCAQTAGLVPIVEPEILIDGNHSSSVSAAVAKRVIKACYAALDAEGVAVEATLLKPMMILPGLTHPSKDSVTPDEVARITLDTMKDCVPSAVPGIMFLSGGMTEAEATRNLNAINVLAEGEGGAPWSLSFSFGRALQSSVMKTWAGRDENAASANCMAGLLAKANSEAQLGVFKEPHPSLMDHVGTLYEGFRGHRSGEDASGT